MKPKMIITTEDEDGEFLPYEDAEDATEAEFQALVDRVLGNEKDLKENVNRKP